MATPIKPKVMPKPLPVPNRAPAPTPKPAVPAVPAPKPLAKPAARVAAPVPKSPPAPEPEQEQLAEETAIVQAQTQALAAPGQFDDELAKYAADIVEDTPIPGGNFISTKAGIIAIGGVEYSDLEIIVLDHIFERTFYQNGYNEDNPSNPVCFAFARKVSDLAPHADSEAPQSDTCANCPMNVWGTAVDGQTGQPRKGKACQERRRLAMISTNGLSAENVDSSEVLYYKTSVTSAKNWDTYVRFLDASFKRPPFAVVTNFSTRPDRKNQYQLVFQPVSVVPEELVPNLIKRYKEFIGANTIMFPYQKNAAVEEQPEQAPAQPVRPRKF